MNNFKVKAGATLAALVVGLSVAAAPAQAGPKFYPKKYGYHHHHHGFGYGAPLAAGLVGALALGAVAANAGQPSCWVEEQERFDRFGNAYIRQVRVCD